MFTTSRLEVAKGNAPDAYATTTFTNVSRYMDIKIWDNPAYIKLSYDGVTFNDPMEFDPAVQSMPYPIFFQAKAFQIQNKTPGVIARYEIVNYS